MKKFIGILCSLALFVSCADEQNDFMSGKTTLGREAVCVVTVSKGEIVPMSSASDGELALGFADEASFDAFKEKLAPLSSDERAALVSRYGILNLHDLAAKADEELEAIGDKASSLGEFKSMYKDYQKKYDGLLALDATDASDVSLYVPKGESVESYIANEKGCYVVGGKVRHYDASKISISSVSAPVTRGTVAGTNEISFHPNDMSNKKIFFSTYLEMNYVRVGMHAKKKMWYGWKNDPARNYFFDSYLNGAYYVSLNSNGQEVVSPRLPRYIFTNNVKDGFNIRLAKRSNNTQMITGEFHVWCDYTAEHDENYNYIYDNMGGFNIPRCLESKAQIVKVDLK